MVDFGVNIELNAASAQAVILQLVNRLDQLEKQAKETGNAGDRMGEKFNSSAQRPLNTLGGLEDKLRRLRGEMEGVEVGSNSFKELAREIAKTESAADKANTSIKKIGDEVSKAGSKFSGFEDIARGAFMRVGELGVEMAQQAGRAVMGFVAQSVMTFADFEKSMQGVKALTGATGGEFESLEKKARELGASTRYSAKEAADAMGFLGMAGFDTNEILAATPGMLDLATAGALDLAEAADIASNVMGQFQIKATDVGIVTNVLAATAATANTNVSQMAEALKYLGPTAQSLGMSLEETAGIIGVLGDAGIQASMAGRALGTSLVRLADPTDKMSSAMEEMNIQAFDSQGQFVGMSELLAQLEDGTKGYTDQQKAANLTALLGSEAFQEINILLNKGSEEYEAYTKKITGTNAAMEMAATRGEGLAGNMAILTSATQEAQIVIGEALNPAMMAATEFMAELITELSGGAQGANGMSSAAEQLAAAIKGVDVKSLAADIRVIVGSVASFVGGVAKLIEMLMKLKGAIESVANLPGLSQVTQLMGAGAGALNTGGTMINLVSRLGGGGGGGGLSGVSGSVSGFSEGGLVQGGSGSGTADDVPAMLSSGEFVLKASAVNQLGTDFLESLNSNNPDFSSLGKGKMGGVSVGSFSAGSSSGSGRVTTDGIERGIRAAREFDGIAARCAATTEAFTKALGFNTGAMDLTAESAKKVGQVMTDFSKIQPGDIIGWSGSSKFGDEHVGTYLGDQKVAHQSGSRGYKFGVYNDLDYFKQQQGAYFVRPNGAGGTAQTAAQTSNSSGTKATQIAGSLKAALGLTDAQAAGIVGNFMREAGKDLNPRINEGGKVGLPMGKGGYGLAQWTGSRQNDLINFAGGKEAAGSLEKQVAFTIKELLGSERNALNKLKQTNTPEDAAAVFEKYYERAGVVALGERQANAKNVYAQLQGGSGGSLDGSGIDDYAKALAAVQKEFDTFAGNLEKFADSAARANQQKALINYESGLLGSGLSSEEIGRKVDYFKVDQEAAQSLEEYKNSLMESGLSAEQAAELYGKAKDQIKEMVLAQRSQIDSEIELKKVQDQFASLRQYQEDYKNQTAAIRDRIAAIDESSSQSEMMLTQSTMTGFGTEETADALAAIQAYNEGQAYLEEQMKALNEQYEIQNGNMTDYAQKVQEIQAASEGLTAALLNQNETQKRVDESTKKAAETQAAYKDIVDNAVGGFTNFTMSVLSGSESIKEATGKLFQSILSNLANKALTSFFGGLFGGFGGGGGGGGFKLFANGGIIDKPTNAIMGEAGAEAVVPLPDGKSIPVVLAGGGGGGTNITVNVSGGGGGTEDGRRLGKQISEAIKSELANQKRSGGLLR